MQVQVFLIRHSHAVDADDELDDPSRFLSPKGRKLIRAVGQSLRAQNLTLDAILFSPLVRAVQTAELLADALDFHGVIETLPALAPGVSAKATAARIAKRGERIALVGHEPGLSSLGAYLCQRPTFPALRKAQISLVEDGKPRWYLDPDTLECRPLSIV